MTKEQRKEQFKKFVRSHPGLKNEVDSGNKTWRTLFDEWELFGEDDPMWNDYSTSPQKDKVTPTKTETKSEDSSSGLVSQLTSMVKNMDGEQMNQHLDSLNRAIGAIQGILGQFQGTNKSTETRSTTEPAKKNPFSFRQD
ncbi:YlbD family protein [Mangrovibacillus cuniculi]|uniref:YlbD family protein n=1 Tax=Mangrovibacillus cuniculi TaxID=2593652 RepID=UPI001EFA1E28|nr:YlbD family protein [Mangrovibacillus cuniculi]